MACILSLPPFLAWLDISSPTWLSMVLLKSAYSHGLVQPGLAPNV